MANSTSTWSFFKIRRFSFNCLSIALEMFCLSKIWRIILEASDKCLDNGSNWLKIGLLFKRSKFLWFFESYVISVNKIKSIEGNTVEIGGRRIPIGRNYVKVVRERIFNNEDPQS